MKNQNLTEIIAVTIIAGTALVGGIALITSPLWYKTQSKQDQTKSESIKTEVKKQEPSNLELISKQEYEKFKDDLYAITLIHTDNTRKNVGFTKKQDYMNAADEKIKSMTDTYNKAKEEKEKISTNNLLKKEQKEELIEDTKLIQLSAY